jgi:hypothetical protein
VPTSLVAPRIQDGVRGTSRRRGGGFAKQVTGNVKKGEAPMLLWERPEIRLDEISTVSSLAQISTRTGASPKSTPWQRRPQE